MSGTTQPPAGLGYLELSSLLGDNQIALQEQPQSKPHHVAMSGGDNRFPVDRPGQQVGRVGIMSLRTAQALEFFTCAQLALLNVGAAGESASSSAENRHVSVRI